MKNIAICAYFIAALITIDCIIVRASGVNPEELFAERANLALRQVGHQLLTLAADTTSSIPPVEEVSPYKYKLQLDHAFNYDTLPALLHRAIIAHRIEENYHVVIKHCNGDEIVLGYSLQSLSNDNVACQGREDVVSCSDIFVTFFPEVTDTSSNPLFSNKLGLLGILLISGLLFAFFRKKRGRFNENKNLSTDAHEKTTIQLGNYKFNVQNQILQLNDRTFELTFRESKLLHYFAEHANQVQSRQSLIENVWEDEGVMVGRSLDVFISRLRKILKADESVQIKTIHGVGYRLEVAT